MEFIRGICQAGRIIVISSYNSNCRFNTVGYGLPETLREWQQGPGRAGDYVVDIAKTVSFMEDRLGLEEISEKGRLAIEMPIDATDGFVHNDAKKTRIILEN